jgi:hypothetical protein
MRSSAFDWQTLVGRWVMLNSFGIVHVVAVDGRSLLTGEGAARTAIPLAAIHSLRILTAAGVPGPLVEVGGLGTSPAD